MVKWQHVVSYLTPLADTHEIPFCGPVVQGTFEGVLYVYVSQEKPMFLGRTKQRLVLDCDQANFMIVSGMVGGGGGEGASGADSRAVKQDSRKDKTKQRKRKRKGKRQESSSSVSPTESDEEEEDGEEEEGE